MKIVDAPRPKSKAAIFRETVRKIAGKEKAAFFDKESDFKAFATTVRKMGFKPHSQKQQKGWKVWC